MEEGEVTRACVARSKAQKHRGSLEMAEELQRLSLEEKPRDVPLARIQHLFSFGASGSGQFPEPEKESFQERLALIPRGMAAGFGWLFCPCLPLTKELGEGA